MWQDLRRIFDGLGEAAEVRTIVLAGNGGNFSAGADLGEFATVRATVALAKAYEETEMAALRAILACPKPTIAQIEGYAVGGGCAVALACDIRVADSNATFFIPAGKLGNCLQHARMWAAAAPGRAGQRQNHPVRRRSPGCGRSRPAPAGRLGRRH